MLLSQRPAADSLEQQEPADRDARPTQLVEDEGLHELRMNEVRNQLEPRDLDDNVFAHAGTL